MKPHPNQAAIDAELAEALERAVMEPEDAARADMRAIVGELRQVRESLASGAPKFAQARVEALLQRLDREPNGGTER